MKGLFQSQDTKFTLKTALFITCVPALMMGLIVYSVWLLLAMNHSYFLANGFPLDSLSLGDFMNYLLESQLEYLPYLGLFFISVFFIGMFLAYLILRPFNQLMEMCQEIKNAKGERIKIIGLGNRKVLIKVGNFLCQYSDAQKNKKMVEIPNELKKVNGPVMDFVFYFQFFCIMSILTAITVTSIYVFTHQLHDSIIQAAINILKAPKGIALFLSSQERVFELIVFFPSLISVVLYGFIARLIISRIQGVTYAYVRDICEIASGNTARRLTPREEDPGRQAAQAVNEVLDMYHPRLQAKVDDQADAPTGLLKTLGF
jgi:hypothetical protein